MKIKPDQLKFGDVSFYTRDSFTSRAIKTFDGSDSLSRQKAIE